MPIRRGELEVPIVGQAGPELKGILKQPKGFDPSKKLDDIRLAYGWYLLQGNEVKRGTKAETEGGIVAVVDGETKIPNMAIVRRKAEKGCAKADVGDYVPMPALGDRFDDKKAYPLVRFLGDEESLWLIHEDNVHAAIPPRKKKK